jgi:eukaryotic-like serine/threonine-protein kinase
MVDVAMTAASERPLPVKIGRYRVLCELGQGAMAVLYLGRAVGPGSFERLFAIKMIHEHLCRENAFIQMFLNEARIAARLHHPNVISVYEVDVDQGRYYLAMDYVSGENLALTLKHTWNRNRPFPFDIASYVIASACEGLHAAHELKDVQGAPLDVVHRDVAPQNIMIGYDGTIRVMDFGIAKAADQVSQTRPGTMKGTVAYMSPEQIRGEPLDRKADIFALGVVLWETTVGKRLFKSTNDINTAARVLRMNVPRPSSLRPGYPERLEEIVLRALARDTNERYQTTRELGEALQDYLLSAGRRVTTSDVESFMKDVFAGMYEQRAEMERKASAPVPPERVQNLPDRDSDHSLSVISANEGAEELLDESFLEFKQEYDRRATAKAVLIDKTTTDITPATVSAAAFERTIETSVIRDGRRTGRTPAPQLPSFEMKSLLENDVSQRPVVVTRPGLDSSEVPALPAVADPAMRSEVDITLPPGGGEPVTTPPDEGPQEPTIAESRPAAFAAALQEEVGWFESSGPATSNEQHTRVVKRETGFEINDHLVEKQRSKRQAVFIAIAAVAIAVGIIGFAVAYKGTAPTPKDEQASARAADGRPAQAGTAGEAGNDDPRAAEAAKAAEAEKARALDAARAAETAKAAQAAKQVETTKQAEAMKPSETARREEQEAARAAEAQRRSEAAKAAEAERRAEAASRAEAARQAEAARLAEVKAAREAKARARKERAAERHAEKRTKVSAREPPREEQPEPPKEVVKTKAKPKHEKKSDNMLFGGDDL